MEARCGSWARLCCDGQQAWGLQHLCCIVDSKEESAPCRVPHHQWIYPPSNKVLKECGMHIIQHYIDVRQQSYLFMHICGTLKMWLAKWQKDKSVLRIILPTHHYCRAFMVPLKYEDFKQTCYKLLHTGWKLVVTINFLSDILRAANYKSFVCKSNGRMLPPFKFLHRLSQSCTHSKMQPPLDGPCGGLVSIRWHISANVSLVLSRKIKGCGWWRWRLGGGHLLIHINYLIICFNIKLMRSFWWLQQW